ncbi:PAS domain S-box-containing protein [Trinickia symbiotica]|nr:HAMP domain-containing histidine kinase [Trinickia symbiotica]PPK43035.1 PAS domain S-box-containing protein [Trinickia symbiotica]
MKISSRLALTGLFAALAMGIIGTMLFIASQQVKTDLANNETASSILNAVSSLRYLTLEYVRGHEARPRAQWQLRNASLAKLLSDATRFAGGQEMATVDDLRHRQANIEALFDELLQDRNGVQTVGTNDAVMQEVEIRLTGQILNRTQDMISDALSLSDSTRRSVRNAQEQMNIAAMLFAAVAVVTLVATVILVLRRIIRPLALMREGTVIVGAGDLEHRLAVTSSDEIGELSRAFNHMVEALRKTTVSRDQLEHANEMLLQEVSERKQAEERFRQVVEAAPNAMIIINRDGRIVLVNSQTEKVFGYARDQLVGQGIELLVPERYRRDHPGYRSAFCENPGNRPMGAGRHLYGLRRDGTEVPLEIGLNPLETSEGMYVLAAIVDITERKRQEELFRATVESAPTAIVMADHTGRITLVNALTESIFGYERDELIGQPVEKLLPQRYRAAHPGLRDSFFFAPSARRMGEGRDLNGQRKDGSEFPVEIGLNPVETSTGSFVLAAIADITERKRAEEELRHRTEELARSNRDLEQFAYVASHDLQEPLRAIAGPLQLLQRRYLGQLDARADEYIGHAVDGASRMQTLIDDLLAFSRMGRSAEPWEPTESAQALEYALGNLSAAIEASGAQIVHEDLPVVHAISTQISLLFQNLVGNAIKFRSKDRPLRIHVGADARSDAWVFHVRDNGIGIDPQYFERIFLIFQRLHTRRDYPGTGIGLALCKRIVEHHGGRIWVESDPGNGTTFLFTLPRDPGSPSK